MRRKDSDAVVKLLNWHDQEDSSFQRSGKGRFWKILVIWIWILDHWQ